MYDVRIINNESSSIYTKNKFQPEYKREEEKRQEAAKAHWLANIRGKGIVSSHGMFIA